MTKYSADPVNPAKAAKARGSYLRTHFKHCREIMGAIRGMKFNKAVAYLEDVLNKKQAIPYTVFNRGCGRSAQAKNLKVAGSLVRWPQKATKMILALLQNAKANAESAEKSLDLDSLVVSHSQANAAPKQRRRTYRAHGRINAYMASPAHIEVILAAREAPVAKAEDKPVKVSRKRAAQLRLKVGGGVDN